MTREGPVLSVPDSVSRLALATRQRNAPDGRTNGRVLVCLIAGIVVALLGLLPTAASATKFLHQETRIAAIAEAHGQLVGPSRSVLAVQGRETAPNYDRIATGSRFAATLGTPDMATTSATVTSHAYDSAPTDFWKPRNLSVQDAYTNRLGIATSGLALRPRAPPIAKVMAAEGETASADASSVGNAITSLSAGRSAGVYTVSSPEELQSLYDELSAGGTRLSNTYPGEMVELPDGTTVGLRQTSTSGGPTIDVKLPDGTQLKVHVSP